MKKKFFVFLLLSLSHFAFAASTETAPITATEFPDPVKFPFPVAYKPNVDFWMRVYGEWADDQMVIHDSENMGIVFDVVQVPDENELLRVAARAKLKERVDQIQRILLELDRDPQARTKSPEYKEVYDLYANISNPAKFRIAASSVRVQQGIKTRFHHGLEQMTLYLKQIKGVFREEGLPEELAYLPLVESSFNNVALSKTRAAGIWQFMSGTARIFGMKVNSDLDERLDPIAATHGAAQYLKRSYALFGNWPVAIMSYNHGQQGMMNAVDTLGTSDFMRIVNGYNGRQFGFASRNFYGEFLAACKVMNDAEKYFDGINYQRALVSDSIRLAHPLWASSILNHSNLTREDLRAHNPALQSSVIFSKRPIPAGYQLRLPAGKFPDLPAFITQLRAAPEPSPAKVAAATSRAPKETSRSAKTKRASASAKTYVVRRGDTLFSISKKFSTRVEDIRRLNGLSENHNIFPGQRLLLSSR